METMLKIVISSFFYLLGGIYALGLSYFPKVFDPSRGIKRATMLLLWPLAISFLVITRKDRDLLPKIPSFYSMQCLSFEELTAIPKIGGEFEPMFVFRIPNKPDMGLVVRFNSRWNVRDTWVIKRGKYYSISSGGVKTLPQVERDRNPLRRYCRERGLSLEVITQCERDNKHSVIGPDDPPVRIVESGNPSKITRILVVEGEQPKTYEELIEMLS